jgi:hypothetical protein
MHQCSERREMSMARAQRLNQSVVALRSATLAICLAIGIVPAAQSAPSSEVDAALYIEYLSMKSGGLVCGERISGFSNKFAPWFATWQKNRFDQLNRGPSALARTQEQHGVDFEELILSVAQKLREVSLTVATKECSTLLEAVAPHDTR